MAVAAPDLIKPHAFYTRNQARSLLQLRRATVNELVSSGRLRSVRVGNAIRIPADALIEFGHSTPTQEVEEGKQVGPARNGTRTK